MDVANDTPFISVVIPVKNEAAVLSRCLESLTAVDYPKDSYEIIIADGMSTDNTREIALRFKAKVVENHRQLVVSGRNCGFRQARGEIIAFTDADCSFDSRWLKNSVKYFQDQTVGGIGGVVRPPEDSSGFESAINFIFYLAEIFRTTSHRQGRFQTGQVNDIPGCNAFYRRQALEKVMPVDENLLTAEDVWMNFAVRECGYKLMSAPDVILWHYRRNSPKRFLRQIYRFSIGRVQAGKKSVQLLSIFHILAGLSIPLSLAVGIWFYLSGAWGLFLKSAAVFLIVFVLFSYLKTRSLPAVLNMPLALLLFLTGWSAGFLREIFFPLKDAKGK
jgi:cellulose synthase/poly-beta-1,6-N-acetylglucosamine synthase-like glycosyltransferase